MNNNIFLSIIGILILMMNCVDSFSQEKSKKIIFEQIALDYLADSIIGKKEPFLKSVIHFDGIVDSTITTIFRSKLLDRYPDDKELEKEYELTKRGGKVFWQNNKKEQFELKIKGQIQRKIKIKYKSKSKAIRLIIFQNKEVGKRNFVWIRTFTGSGDRGHDLYFVMDIKGTVLDWIETSFIF